MRKLMFVVAMAATVCLLSADVASARGRCGGGWGGGYCGGWGGGYCGGWGGYCGSYGGYCGGYSYCSPCYSYGYCAPGYAYGGYGYGHHAAAPIVGAPVYAAAPTEAPVILSVSLPVDAKLMIDDTATTVTGATRTFQSPPLALGKDYQYTLKAEVVRDGKPLTLTQQVTFRAGETKTVTLDLPATSVAGR